MLQIRYLGMFFAHPYRAMDDMLHGLSLLGPRIEQQLSSELEVSNKNMIGRNTWQNALCFFPLINGNKMLFFLLSPTGKGVVGKKTIES